MGVLSRALVASSLLSLAATIPTPNLVARQDQQPCAQVAAEQEKQKSGDSKASTFHVPASLAYDCLTSVPFKKDDAIRLLDGLSAFWQWQSTVDYLMDPPEGYQLPGTDIFARLADIRNKAVGNQYQNEYDFQSEVRDLAVSVHDGHFNLELDALGIFTFRREDIGPIVSVSADGKKMPEIFAYNDLKSPPTDDSWAASPIVKIDDKEVGDWLSDLSYQGSSLDPDALFNELFYTSANEAEGKLGNFFAMTGEYTGATTKLGFANGTTTEYENSAAFKSSFKDVRDGESFYNRFCNGELPVGPGGGMGIGDKSDLLAKEYRKIEKREEPADKRPMYPDSVVEIKSGHLAGYFVEDEPETAVLSISGFDSNNPDDFSQTVTKFLTACKDQGKKKLIIDVTSNGGGMIFLGYDVFKQLFPDTPIDDAANMRATDQLAIIGNTVNKVLADPEASQTEEGKQLRGSFFDLNSITDINDKVYDNWMDLFGPTTNDRGNFTNPLKWNFNDESTSLKSGGLVVSGYLSKSDLPPPVFKPEDMVLLTDGTCGSTCSIFANLLTSNGVQTITTGGRPRDGPVQAVAGVRGTQVLSFEAIYSAASGVMKLAPKEQQDELASTDLGEIAEDGPYVLARSYGDGTGARVNVRNGIDPNDPQRTPREFIYQPADCRIWSTAEMVLNPQKLWSTVAKTAFADGECTPGSTPEE